MKADEVITYMESLRNDRQRRELMRFFKTGPGEYGEGDEFLGLKVPQTGCSSSWLSSSKWPPNA